MTKATKVSGKSASQRGRPEMSPAKRADMQSRISGVAEKLFKEAGYSKVSMRRIAQEIGCTPMALYRYYDNKFDVLRSLWGGVFDALFESLDKVPRKSSAQENLVELGTAYVDYWLSHPEHYRLVFMAEGVTQPEVSLFLDNPELLTKYGLFVEAIQKVEPARASKEDSKEDSKAKLDFFISTLNGIAHSYVTISRYKWTSPREQIKYAAKAVSV